ncbi:PEP/pyruvate-binding domain-containing protein [Desulforhopalus singaporensis]|uniref:Response regulator receiver domain-containing protein n=1 Tax=Desulforhopalus singaporensis TaxID=91360 RepID=A0A1H0TGJ2_9BACT|nr:PEP/pyruvate-binding domain-containing protein [Desulforhopalus singaporensis]SDP52780.1 Response regulator receiver domain-containing protein [Desulforhopalus singaporensis]
MFIASKDVIPDFDPHFKVFHDLMPFKVQEILLVSSLYDAFIMEEDGSLATRLINEYHGLNLSKPPKMTRISSAEEAVRMVKEMDFDMVITMPFLGGVDAFKLGTAIKEVRPDIPVIVVAHNLKSSFLDKVNRHGIDRVFLWCCEADLLLAIIKNVEDHRNVDPDTERAMVRVIIYVEDSPLYRSLFLPLIYNEVVRQTQSVLDESLNERHRLLRMRARPKILMATNYEEALTLYEAYKPYVFGIISDARFPRAGKTNVNAGMDFLKTVRSEIADLPLLMVSSEEANRKEAQSIPAVFIDKKSPHIKDELHNFFLTHLGFGDFIFRLPDETAIGHASNLAEFERQLKIVPEASLCYHTKRNHFSNWVMARAEVILAKRLHKDYVAAADDLGAIRDDLVHKVHSLRRLRQQGVVVGFDADIYDSDIMDFVKIGKGSMGGKARGIAFIWACLQSAYNHESILSEFPVIIPKTCVITADGFDAFVEDNNLYYCKNYRDCHIADLFLDAPLPAWLRQELREFLKKVEKPLSVRSSSLLEDGQFKPYAGLYSTYFLANNYPDFNERLAQLESAIKLVYASTWFEGPRSFSKMVGYAREDSMAVIIQELAGDKYGDFWYPAVCGVAQSHNFYPVMDLKADEGICHIALGLGKTVVEGGKSLWFSPRQPKKLFQFDSVDDMLRRSQTQFWALDISPENCFERNTSNLVLRNVQDAEREMALSLVASTYVAEEHRVRDTILPGRKILTFYQILKYGAYPLAQVLGELLKIGKTGMGGDVEIEFALHLDPDPKKSMFYFLQIRPMATGRELADVNICDAEIDNGFGYITQLLGHGHFKHITDIVYVHPETFDLGKTQQMAWEIGEINRKLTAGKVPFLLIGPGRWGSADPWLGIPVQWNQISGAAAIIEVRNSTIKADASQGTHFFQNITSLGIPYMTLNEDGARKKDSDERRRADFFDWQWLEKQRIIERLEYICHARTANPFVLKCDGTRSESVLFEPALSGNGSCAKEPGGVRDTSRISKGEC